MTEALYLRMAYTVLISLFMFCGALRCCNLWRQTNKTIDDLYPARKSVAAAYLSVILLMPCVISPLSPAAQLLARCFWILWIPSVSSLAFVQLFSPDSAHGKLRLALVGCLPAIFLLALSVLSLVNENFLASHAYTLLLYIGGAAGIALAVCLIYTTLWVYRLVCSCCSDSSGDDNLPRRLALRVFFLPIAVLIVAWIVFMSASTTADLLFIVWVALSGAVMLVVILHPRPSYVSASANGSSLIHNGSPLMHNGSSLMHNASSRQLPVELIDKIERQIRDVVEHERLFLDPNLTKSLLLSRLSTNDNYLHIVLKERFGPFNRYINLLRLDYSVLYREQHPDAKHEEVAMKCGFGSVRTYYRARKLYGFT